jgi:carbon monoxide dehydrogenase subunit G
VVTALLAILLLAVPCAAETPDVSIDTDQGSCRVRGGFRVSAPPELAWDVLADYDHIGTYVRSIRESRIERQPDGRMLLKQVTVASAFLFSRKIEVLLALEESRPERIAFRDVSGKDFSSYEGEWRVTAVDGGARVDYALAAEPRGAMARTFCRGAMRNGARELLEQVRQEMLRRARAAMPPHL